MLSGNRWIFVHRWLKFNASLWHNLVYLVKITLHNSYFGLHTLKNVYQGLYLFWFLDTFFDRVVLSFFITLTLHKKSMKERLSRSGKLLWFVKKYVKSIIMKQSMYHEKLVTKTYIIQTKLYSFANKKHNLKQIGD